MLCKTGNGPAGGARGSLGVAVVTTLGSLGEAQCALLKEVGDIRELWDTAVELGSPSRRFGLKYFPLSHSVCASGLGLLCSPSSQPHYYVC